MPGHLGFIFLSFPLQPRGLEFFSFFPNEIEQKLQDSGNKISAATISRRRIYDPNSSQNHRSWHTDKLGFGIPSKGRISQARERELPFLVGEGDAQNFPWAHPGACSMPRESSSLWVTAGHQPSDQGTPLPTWVPSKGRNHPPRFSFSFPASGSS